MASSHDGSVEPPGSEAVYLWVKVAMGNCGKREASFSLQFEGLPRQPVSHCGMQGLLHRCSIRVSLSYVLT